MANNILKEAIADAKAVREVALANAKAALEEAFTPRLQSMLSAKLSEDLNEEEDLDETYMEDEKEVKNETYDEDEKDGIDETYMEDEKADLDEEIDLEEILSELELDEGDDSKEETVDEVKDKDLDENNTSVRDKVKSDEDKMDEAKDEDLDEAKDNEEEKLDELGRPVYKAEEANYAGYTADRVHEGSENFDLDALLEEINNLDENEEDEVNEVRDSSELDEVAEETNEALGTMAALGGIIAAAGGLSAIEVAAEDPAFQAKYPKVAKALAMMQKVGNKAAQTRQKEGLAMESELAETREALETVRTELNEVNLLNSKLLYVNRIFKANNLNEVQKLRVVETLDNATNIKEAKLIYETIKDTFTISKEKKITPKKSIRENLGMASKAAGISTARKKPILNESNDMMARMQKLANIKINQ